MRHVKLFEQFTSLLNEGKGVGEKEWKALTDPEQYKAILAIRGKKEAQRFAGDFFSNLPEFIVRDLAKLNTKEFMNEAVSKTEDDKIIKYLDSLKTETLFDFNNDAHGASDDAATADQWDSNKNDLDHSDLVDFALDHIVNNSIKLKELKKLISSTYS
jgi:hypothetical protein